MRPVDAHTVDTSPSLTRRALLRTGLTATLATISLAGGTLVGRLLPVSPLSTALATPGTPGTPASPATGSAPQPPTRWGMVILARRFADPELAARVVAACHTAHNVPDIPRPSPPLIPQIPDRSIHWLRPLPYARTFADQPNRWLADALQRTAFPTLCNHCDNPPCVRVCPTGATFQTPDGRIGQDPHRCIGCRYCMVACPYGARSFNFCDPRPYVTHINPDVPLRSRGVVEKCTLCPDRLAVGLSPHCVAAADGAMIIGNMLDADSAPRRLLARTAARQRLPELGTGPAVWYMLDDLTGWSV